MDFYARSSFNYGILPFSYVLFDHIKMESFNVVSVKQSINKKDDNNIINSPRGEAWAHKANLIPSLF